MDAALRYSSDMRTRDVDSTPIRGPLERPVGEPPSGLPGLDRDLTFYRDGLRWTFQAGRVCVDGHDLNRLINDNPENAGFFMGVAEGLNDYRKRVVASRLSEDQFAKFDAMIEALLGKLMGKLKKFYDQKMSGLSWTLQNGQLILNGINVRSFLALYRIRKTDKAKKFLRGLKNKLALLLENRRESPDYERVRETLREIFEEIDRELAGEEAPRASRRLLPSGAHAS